MVRDFRGTKDERISGYIGQVRYINQQIEKAIDAILKNSSIPPIIILQGDHGSGINFSRTCLEERAAILNAYYLPGLTNDPVYEKITPVNTFRVIFNQYFKAHFELLEDKVFYNDESETLKFTDVTPESQVECVLP